MHMLALHPAPPRTREPNRAGITNAFARYVTSYCHITSVRIATVPQSINQRAGTIRHPIRVRGALTVSLHHNVPTRARATCEWPGHYMDRRRDRTNSWCRNQPYATPSIQTMQCVILSQVRGGSRRTLGVKTSHPTTEQFNMRHELRHNVKSLYTHRVWIKHNN